MNRAVLDSRNGKRYVYVMNSGRGDPTTKSQRVPTKTLRRAHTTKPIYKKYGPHAARRRPTFGRRIVLGRGAHNVINSGLYINVINVYYL